MRNVLALAVTGVLAFGLVGCGGSEAPADSSNTENTDGTESESGEVTLKIGASPTPHAEILAAAKDTLAAEGITLDIIEFNDYVQPNLALESGDLDANFFQHQPYLDLFNQEHDTDLVSIAAVHFEPMSIYAGVVTDLADIPEGTKVGIPNDGTNGGRALLLLEANGLIKLDPEAGFAATKLNIIENPKNLEIIDMEAAQLPLSLSDLGFAVINTNYALQNGLNSSDALASETADSLAGETYANVVAVRAGDESRPELVKLAEVLESAEVAAYVNDTFNGEIIPVH